MGVAVATQRVQGSRQTLIARVVPDVTGIDKTFDYLVPEVLTKDILVGSRVRISLHSRKVAGWVVALIDETSKERSAASNLGFDPSRLLPILAVVGCGPSAEIVDLGAWATRRWAGRLRAFCVAGSPNKIVSRLAAPRFTSSSARQQVLARIAGEDAGGFDIADVADAIAQHNTVLVSRGPHADVVNFVAAVAGHGPTLVVVPTLYRARMLAASLRSTGYSVALMPDDWAQASGGIDVIIGSRSAVWASAPQLSSIVVIDEHDDGLQEERSPTWHARDVAIERARRLNISCLLVSPVPSVSARESARDQCRPLDAGLMRAQWPEIRVIDRSLDERWSSSLLSSELIVELRDHSRRIVCVLNTKGRARLLACAGCRSIARCEACDAAMHLNEAAVFVCPVCLGQRPQVCLACGAGKFALLKLGISRLREEIAAAAGRKPSEVVEVSGAPQSVGLAAQFRSDAMVFVGTEAVLHRVHQADTVVLLDLDAELFAARFRATEISLALIVLASRVALPFNSGGRVLLQTHSAQHQLFDALRTLDFDALMSHEREKRKALSLPPFGALAHITGSGATVFAEQLAKNLLVQVATRGVDDVVARAATVADLTSSLQAVTRPKGSRLKVQIDPPRL